MKTLKWGLVTIGLTVCVVSSAKTWRERALQKVQSQEFDDVLELIRDNTADVPSARDLRNRAELLDRIGMPLSAWIDRGTLISSRQANSDDVKQFAETAIEFGLVGDVVSRASFIDRSLQGKTPSSVQFARAISEFKQGNVSTASQIMPELNLSAGLSERARFEIFKTQAGIATLQAGPQAGLAVLSKIKGWRDPSLDSRMALYRAQLAYDLNKLGLVFEEVSGIARNTPAWHWANIVGAWSAYRKRDFNLALGTTMTLNSPFLLGKFAPESRVIEAAALFELCQFQAAKKSIEQYMSRYKNFQNVLARFAREYEGTLKGVGVVLNYARGQQRAPGGYTQGSWDLLIDALLSQDEFLGIDKLVDSAQKEALRWGDLSSRNRKINRELKKSFIGKLENIQNKGIRLGVRPVRIGISRAKQLIQDSMEAALLIEVEVETRLRDRLLGNNSRIERDVDIDAEVSEGFDFWPFQGEYWRDETANYMYSTVDVCEGT
jgi:hypothetical protein